MHTQLWGKLNFKIYNMMIEADEVQKKVPIFSWNPFFLICLHAVPTKPFLLPFFDPRLKVFSAHKALSSLAKKQAFASCQPSTMASTKGFTLRYEAKSEAKQRQQCSYVMCQDRDRIYRIDSMLILHKS